METRQFTTTIITAAEGCYLTQADDTTPVENRIVAQELALGKNDSAGNWLEITAEEADGIKARREARIAQMMETRGE